MTSSPSVGPTAASDALDPEAAAVLIELAGSIEAVRPNRSRWATVTIAAFAALTCLGLASTTFFPRVTDRGSERRDAAAPSPRAAAATSSQIGGAPPDVPATASPAALPSFDAVVATWRLVADDRGPRLFVSGAAAPNVREITIAIAVRGRAIVTADVPLIDEGGGRDDLVPWSTVVDLPKVAAQRDAVATVTISWVGERTTDGALASVLVLGDGRGRGTGH